ncbi:MAG: transcriptional regulator [Alphaproteobacteria bacterium]
MDTPTLPKVQSRGDTVALDLGSCVVDAIDVADAVRSGIETLDTERLRGLADLFAGDFLAGLSLARSPQFSSWLGAQRRRFRSWNVTILEQLTKSLPPESEELMSYAEQWLQLAPFDQQAHIRLLTAFARHRRLEDGDAHLAAVTQIFEAEGLDWSPLRATWRGLRSRSANGSLSSKTMTAYSLAPLSGTPSMFAEAPLGRRSIAVMPFQDSLASSNGRGGLGDGLTHDVITRLAKLRSLAVIAWGTVLALEMRKIGPEAADRRLDVDYVCSGLVRRYLDRLSVTVELVESRTARILWAETFESRLDELFDVLDQIGNRIVAAIAHEIEMAERNRAVLVPPNSLDAWQAYHRGLWYMDRFTRADNDQAQQLFEQAVRRDPTFARAHAGLSCTHFQAALQGWAERDQAIDLAVETAGQSLIVDDRDPAAHWAMGRAFWLRGCEDQALAELTRAIDLSPSFALGYYGLGFFHAQSRNPKAAIHWTDHAYLLSPCDPLLFGMFANYAIANLRLNRIDAACDWALKAAGRPNAHAHTRAIAALCLATADRLDEARDFTDLIHQTQRDYGIDDFIAAFRFAPDAIALFKQAAQCIGIA